MFEGLLKDEISYELKLRGVEYDRGTTAESMAELLSENKEPAGAEIEDTFIASLDVGKELEVCASKLADLQKLSKFSTPTCRQKCWARLSHIIDRLDRLACNSRAHKLTKASLAKEAYLLQFNITSNQAHSRAPSPTRLHPHTFIPASSDDNTHITHIRKNGGDEKVHLTNSEEVTIPIPTYPTYPTNLTSPYTLSKNSAMLKWGITYDGHTCVLEFLSKVKDLASSCQASEPEMLNNFSHLLTGDALIWFRSYRDSIHSLSQLYDDLKTEFLPVDHDRRLLLQIKGRLQEKSEDIKCYINLMLYEMQKLSSPLSEPEKLDIILANMNTFYIAKLALHDINTIAELKSVCAKLDVAKYRCENRGYLNSGNTELVPGFSTKPVTSKPTPTSTPHPGKISTISKPTPAPQLHTAPSCLKCDGSHHYSKCTVYNTPVCFKCKKPNILTKDCTCSKN